jgi:hypothetical protein
LSGLERRIGACPYNDESRYRSGIRRREWDSNPRPGVTR